MDDDWGDPHDYGNLHVNVQAMPTCAGDSVDQALTCCFKVALDAADEHNDAWSGARASTESR